MSFLVPYKNLKSKEEAYEKAKELIDESYLKKFGVSGKINFFDEEFKIIAEGSGFKIKFNFLESGCEGSLELSFMLNIFKEKILESIKSELEKNI